MWKILFKITFIICANLLAFLCVWLILDALFQTGWALLLASVIVSLPVFGIIMYFQSGKILKELQSYNKHIDGK